LIFLYQCAISITSLTHNRDRGHFECTKVYKIDLYNVSNITVITIMRFISIIALSIFPLYLANGISDCNKKSTEKQELQEYFEKCNYIINTFSEENMCFHPIYYLDIYKNQTTIDEVREQCKYYKTQLSFIVAEIYFYILILVLFIMSMRNPIF